MSRTCILVVDDDPDLRSVLQERLTYRGYRVETAENGHDALTKLDQAVFDGVLLDYMMPGITGVTVLQHIRQHRPLLPVVMMTGETSSQVPAQARAAGARACCSSRLTKGSWNKWCSAGSEQRRKFGRRAQDENGTEVNATRDALMDHRVANRLRHDEGSAWKEREMIEPKRHDMVGLSPLPGSVVHMQEADAPPHRKPLRLTISVEKIDLLLADIQKEVEDLQRQMTNLRLVTNSIGRLSA